MTILKPDEKFSKICSKCKNLFTPIKKYQKVCTNCKPSSISDSFYLRSQKLKKIKKTKEKLKERLKLLSNANNFQAIKETK